MNNNENENYIDPSDVTEFSLEAILAEYKSIPPSPKEDNTSASNIKERSRAIIMEALDHTIGTAKISSVDEMLAEAEDGAEEEEIPPREELELTEVKTAEEAENKSAYQPEDEESFEPEDEAYEIDDQADRESNYADADFPRPEPEPEPSWSHRKTSAKDLIMAPIIAILAMAAIRKHQRKSGESEVELEEEKKYVPDPAPDKAAKFYTHQIAPLKMRGMLTFAMCAVLMYISYGYTAGFPMLGAMNGSIRVTALMCLLIELVVIVLGLDIFTNGILTLFRRKPGAESLVAVSCLLSVVDAAVIAGTNNAALGLPFCAVSSLSMLFAIWGARLTCSGFRSTFRALSISKNPYVITAECGVDSRGSALLKSRIGTEGFIRRSEMSDAAEDSYNLFSPFLLIAAFILSVLASIVRGRPGDFFHTFSAISATCASFSALIAFPLPFSIISKRLHHSGAAVAGYAGISDIGKSQRVVITDADIFPPGTLAIESIRILEGAYTDKVVSYTGSLLAASGSGLASVFTDLIKRNAYAIEQVDDFNFHEGGGITATIRGEEVFVGSSGFMHLMGIRMPQKLNVRNAAFTAISGVLVGIFNVSYVPVVSVQDALVTLLRSKRYPIFAIRDFNITPLLIRQKFKMQTEGFDFPSFAERYRISSAEPGTKSQIAAILSRDGLNPMIETSDRGKKAYRAIRLCIILSLLGSFVGIVLMFSLCWTASYDAASVANMMSFMFLWLVPVFMVSLGLNR